MVRILLAHMCYNIGHRMEDSKAGNGPTTFEDALGQYRELLLASRNLAPKTRREYTNDLTDLFAFLRSRHHIATVAKVERLHLESYLAELDARGLTGNTRRRKVASIRSLFGFLTDQGLIPVDPARRLIPPEREHLQPRVLTEGEYKRLQLACAHETRDAAVIELLLQTGMRLSELASVKLSDFDLPAKITRDEGNVGSVHVVGKGRKDRTITLNWKACKAIKAYLQARPKLDAPELFMTKFNESLGPRGIQHVVAKYLGDADIQNASVHTLRHTFATHMVRKGTKLGVVQQALGHASLETTAIYVNLAREVMDKELQANAL